MNRRDFMKHTVLTGAAAAVSAAPGRASGRVPAGERVTLGIIGAGARAQQLIEAAQQIPGLEIVALCDAYAGRATRAQARAGGTAAITKDASELLARPGIDAVLVGTPDHLHKAITVAALDAGKDVYVEKPMTYTIDEGLEIIAAVKRNKRVLQVGSQGISSLLNGTARDLVKSGKLGKV